ncbi:MAG: beta-N-acetylglucosaminidase [Porphyromonas sp.]|nr:beta-N-acetylglucosaminidase [Porphyromonas sp.]
MSLKTILLSTSIVLSSFSVVLAQKHNPSPVPHSIVWGDTPIALSQRNLVVKGEKWADKSAYKKLSDFTLHRQIKSKAFTITIGEVGDKAVARYAKFVPTKPNAYYLKIDGQGAWVVGADEAGTFYGVSTLLDILSRNEVYPVEIKDAPDVADRGVVEGFYGTPWSFDARVSMIEAIGESKMNIYIYGPKDDPYHSSPHWRNPYPADEAEKIRRLVEVANQNKVQFVWAIHPGKDIKWNDEDRQNLLSKFDAMYQKGVRAYAVFFDDISGEGTKAEKQAELLNFLHDNFVAKKGDVAPLIICPTEYNKGWANVKGGYLRTLGQNLHPSIRIMWTGNTVVADIDVPTMEWINEQIGRKAYIWWNYPVTDYVRDHILLGPVYGNSKEIADKVSGFVSNPMEHAEASKIAVYSVGDYLWNMKGFDENASWKASLKKVMPRSYEALEVVGRHNSDLGENGHRYRREESAHIAPIMQKWIAGTATSDERNMIRQEYEKMEESGDILLHSTDNPSLLKEIGVWLPMFIRVGSIGQEVIALQDAATKGDKDSFMKHYYRIRTLQQEMYKIDTGSDLHPHQPGVKSAERVMLPAATTVFAFLVSEYNKKYGTDLKSDQQYLPHKIYTNSPAFEHQPLAFSKRNLSITKKLEYTKLATGEYVGIWLDNIYTIADLHINLGIENWAEGLSFFVGESPETAQPINLQQHARNKKLFEAKRGEIIKAKVLFIRNNGAEPVEIRLEQFSFVPKS